MILDSGTYVLGPHLTGVSLARYRLGKKIPILDPRAIGYRMGLKIGDFFPMAVERHQDPRKKGFCFLSISRVIQPREADKKQKERHRYLALTELLSPTGISVAWRPGRAPGPGTPPRPPPGGGVLHRRP